MNWDLVKQYELELIEVVAAVAFGMAVTHLYYLFINDSSGAYFTLVLVTLGTILLALATVKTVNQCEVQLEALQRNHSDQPDQTDDSPDIGEPFVFPEDDADDPKHTLDKLFDRESK